ncbi:MAG: hypothetical protein FRX48_07838 [Lasallia pustulata]|uniref:Uncharacterized protein n=1 Tax=Lasallia pustulata TaxID=136370 RepID=A0A5M8PFJ5_9LECA|nr:MAG: hypothetical protein FRX48_07838 [Lasallia pustulata]
MRVGVLDINKGKERLKERGCIFNPDARISVNDFTYLFVGLPQGYASGASILQVSPQSLFSNHRFQNKLQEDWDHEKTVASLDSSANHMLQGKMPALWIFET